jgi:hypothetical protein
VNIWITDLDMQCLASSPPISPLVKRYEKGSPELILKSDLLSAAVEVEEAEPTEAGTSQKVKGKRKSQTKGEPRKRSGTMLEVGSAEVKKRQKR